MTNVIYIRTISECRCSTGVNHNVNFPVSVSCILKNDKNIYRKTCIKRSLMGQSKSGLLRQVTTSYLW